MSHEDYERARKMADPYRWHDLRRNPGDLPKEGEPIVYLFENKGDVNHIRHLHFIRYRKWYLKESLTFKAIAWKRIEPFEEEE